MRKLILPLCLVLISGFALAQETPKSELFAGYSFLRSSGTNFGYGWNGAFTGNFNNWLGFTGDISGNYHSETASLGGVTAKVSEKLHTFTFGPTVSYRESKYVPFAHLLLGVSRLSAKVTETGLPDVSDSTTGFAMILGGGVDVPVGKTLYFRPQADFLGSHFTGGWMKSFRLSAGIVYRWGVRK